MLILVFDTETSGLPKSRSQSIMESHNWPFILQIAWILYDSDKNLILKKLIKLLRYQIMLQLTKKVLIYIKLQKKFVMKRERI
jgi:hypothetical protein